MIGYLAMACTFLCIWLMGKKLLLGPIMGVIGSALWVAFGIMAASPELILTNLGIGALNARAAYLWHKEK